MSVLLHEKKLLLNFTSKDCDGCFLSEPFGTTKNSFRHRGNWTEQKDHAGSDVVYNVVIWILTKNSSCQSIRKHVRNSTISVRILVDFNFSFSVIPFITFYTLQRPNMSLCRISLMNPLENLPRRMFTIFSIPRIQFGELHNVLFKVTLHNSSCYFLYLHLLCLTFLAFCIVVKV